MENWNIIEILKLGLPGLVFILSILSYGLLSKEAQKEHPDAGLLSLIRTFMYVNLALAVLTLIPQGINWMSPGIKYFDLEARTGSIPTLEQGNAAVCTNSSYTNTYLLIRDKKSQRLIQVFASLVIPCDQTKHVVLNDLDAHNLLGWEAGTNSSEVELAPAPPGCKFTI